MNSFNDYVLERIFININPYDDWNSAKLVNRKWRRVSTKTLARIKRIFYHCLKTFSWKLIDEEQAHAHLSPSERCSHSVCYNPSDYSMYMFGGCTSEYTSFNDLWRFNLSTREWFRIIIGRSPLPSAKALSTLVLYGENLILFGGFSKSGGLNPIHQTSTFYNELHLFNKKQNCWEEIISENTAPHLAGHTASIVGDFMLVFGGSMGSSYNNNVYVLDILRRIWQIPSIPGPCPPKRYGHSQILLDNNHLIIFGGCGGPSVMLNDVWLLEFDLYRNRDWQWIQMRVENLEMTPPYTWCHRGVKVGSNAVVISRPTKFTIKRFPRRRRTSVSHSCSARLTSPDSPQDRRAVAAAFRKEAELAAVAVQQNRSQQTQQNSGASNCIIAESGTLRPRRRPMLTSKSLDEKAAKEEKLEQNDSEKSHQQKSGSVETSSHTLSTENMGNNTGSSGTHGPPSSLLLQRTCSIPAIIVGEMPKLIVTTSNEPTSIVTPHSLSSQSFPSSATPGSTNETVNPSGSHTLQLNITTNSSKSLDSSPSKPPVPSTKNNSNTQNSYKLADFEIPTTTRPNGAPSIRTANNNNTSICESSMSSVSSSAIVVDDISLSDSDNSPAEHLEAVREYYVSLLHDEYNRLRIVELVENLGNINERLDNFLIDRVPYLSKQERFGIVDDFLNSHSFSEDENSWRSRMHIDSGKLIRRSSSSLNASRESIACSSGSVPGNSNKSSISEQQSFSRHSEGNLQNLFGQSYARRMCVYVLHLQNAISHHTVHWKQFPVEDNAPEDKILYSMIAARGELVLFGGMRSDSSSTGVDCLNVANERHIMSSETWILRPRYDDF